jgi:valyl-tRNA synthetase
LTPANHGAVLKPLDDEFHKAYIPAVVESGWYAWWEKEGFFKPEFGPDGKVKKEGHFSMAWPPPNVTGALHMGHALTNALQDTMVRWNRMHGKTTLWVPGCDHAGIATQAVVENMLWRREKKTRHDLGREALVKLIWEWKGDYHQKINSVLRRMGGSFDWTREAFTMDENLSAAVTETFVKLHEEGVIYRANRLVNWDVKLNTSLSNLEVNNKDIEGRTLLDVPGYDRKVEFGVLTHFQYEVEGSDEKITVATTRPETMLGDSGIVVNPKDKRYEHLVGKMAKHPFIPERKLPIVADEYADMEFGSGAVKMTPAHDPNDFKLGQKHNLEFINILNDNGTLNHNTGQFEGLKRFDARYKVIEALKEKGLYVKWESNKMTIPFSERSKDVIEPLLKPQWWMKMKPLAEAAMKAVSDGEIKIKPEFSEKDFFRWLSGINDWCLSRQLWWGHQIPAYFIKIEGEPDGDSDERWVTGRTEAEARKKAETKYPHRKITLERDPDVLDTWFSSGQWPYSTLGWPRTTDDFENFYPTSVMETGWDILFFWVARMIMMGIKMTGQVPFREVYCHSLIRDSEGRKMSKSLGNVIDPIDLMDGIDLQDLNDKLRTGNLDPKEVATATKFQRTAFPDGIPECGTDALRFGLVSYSTGGEKYTHDGSQHY